MKISKPLSIQHMRLWWAATLLLAVTAQAQTPSEQPEEKSYWLPQNVENVSQTAISLDGTWDFNYSGQDKWNRINVPGEAAMQGYAIRHDQPFLYRKRVKIPADYAGKRIILRFDGTYVKARLSINGTFVREHFGGFTRWETDVTSLVTPGKNNEILLELTDRLDDVSYASGYAHHPIGGILRSVTLFALPQSHLYDASIETLFDSLYHDARLDFSCHYTGTQNAGLILRLTDPSGHKVQQKQFTLNTGHNTFSLPVAAPQKWDAEHPRLYTLQATLSENGRQTACWTRRIGFREVKIMGDRMMVNGKPVKLRGACRHDIHPTLGRTTTPALDSLDALLFKRANMNFVRTSHYPPSEAFLDYCDRYGIYVECETAACFVNTYRQKNYAPGNSQSDTAFAGRYLDQLREMVKAFRSHPSILFWSVGNESAYGSNFQLCHDWLKAADRTRPVVFSYPGSVEQGKKMFDILSMHYPPVDGNLSQWNMTTRGFQGHGIPAIFDEWAHPACYTFATLQTDPNIREFWGQSLDMMWNNLFKAPGGLGGAIWGYVDETFALPEPKRGTAFWKEFARTSKPREYQGNCVGYGEWGIVDVWRRPKPEFWSTKKAYSPVRLDAGHCIDYQSGQRILMTVHNRFDHTRLDEIKATCTYKEKTMTLSLPPVEPHAKGILEIPAQDWQEGEPLFIEFRTAHGELIDAYRPVLGQEKTYFPDPLAVGRLNVERSDSMILINGNGFKVTFDPSTGLIAGAEAHGKKLIEKGPFLNLYINLNHLSGAEVRKTANHITTSPAEWKSESFSYRPDKDGVSVLTQGRYGNIRADFRIRITARGELLVDYCTEGAPNGYLRETGIAFTLPADMERLTWHRNGYWNYYPEGEMSGNKGETPLYESEQAAYGQRPRQPWQADTHEYYYWADAGACCKQPLTRTAKSMKENIYCYTLYTRGRKGSLSVLSPQGQTACRLNKGTDEQLTLYVNNRWDYPEIAWGNYCKTLEALPCFGSFRLQLN